MNSPEPISPSPSTPSSGSPPPEEANFNLQSSTSYLSSLASQVHTALVRGPAISSSPSKRRLPGSSHATGPSDRDPKARKKLGDGGKSNSQYEGPREIASKRDKDELVDSSTVEWLRKEVGDPFTEPGVKF